MSVWPQIHVGIWSQGLTEPVGVGRVVIRAAIPTSISRSLESCVTLGHLPHICGKAGVHIVGIYTNNTAWAVPCHVLIHHRQYLLVGSLVRREYVLASQETALLARIKVEFQRVLGLEARLGEDPQRLKYDDNSRSIVVRSGATGGTATARGVEVRSYNDKGVG